MKRRDRKQGPQLMREAAHESGNEPLAQAVRGLARGKVIFAGTPAALLTEFARRDPRFSSGTWTPNMITRRLKRGSAAGAFGGLRVVVDKWRGRTWVMILCCGGGCKNA